ncbi:hypothetical protein T08_6127 [Trichinella sp. T8]|nr:hypothetical protein T08_6127 [Trichinella sp. T8]
MAIVICIAQRWKPEQERHRRSIEQRKHIVEARRSDILNPVKTMADHQG